MLGHKVPGFSRKPPLSGFLSPTPPSLPPPFSFHFSTLLLIGINDPIATMTFAQGHLILYKLQGFLLFQELLTIFLCLRISYGNYTHLASSKY